MILTQIYSQEGGFGANPSNGVATSVGTDRMVTALVANSPQLLLSISYFWFNSIHSRLFQALEWDKFVRSPKRLRVTAPVGAQREVYLLGVPWIWGVIFSLSGITLHWLVTQILFVIASEGKLFSLQC